MLTDKLSSIQAPQPPHPYAQAHMQSVQRPMAYPNYSSGPNNIELQNLNPYTWDTKEIMKRGFKYLLEGMAVAAVAYFIGKLNSKEVLSLGITAAFVFAILDTMSPTISLGARFGTGFTIGQGLLGGTAIPMAV
jgi:hypothetical protein